MSVITASSFFLVAQIAGSIAIASFKSRKILIPLLVVFALKTIITVAILANPALDFPRGHTGAA